MGKLRLKEVKKPALGLEASEGQSQDPNPGYLTLKASALPTRARGHTMSQHCASSMSLSAAPESTIGIQDVCS